MLPKAPSALQKYMYLYPKRMQLARVGIISTLFLLLGNILFISNNPGFWPYAIFIALTFFYLGISYLVCFVGKDFDFEAHRKLVMKWFNNTLQQEVDIFLPICGEPLELVRNTWKHVADLRAIHTNVKVHVLDDKREDHFRKLAEEFNFNYITRETNELKKAGNLRNAFAKTSAEYIVILDADFCARNDFLGELLPYMYEHPNVAIVQSPQFFAVRQEKNWISNGSAMVQELFYRLIQVNRNTFNGAICVGTSALYRRSALAPFGGTAAIGYSEDVRSGFNVITNGNRIMYVPINLSAGECPEGAQQFFTQMYRWSMGSISLFFSSVFWKSRITYMQRICYLSGMFYYIVTGLSVIFNALPSLFLLIFAPSKIVWYNLLFSVPSLLFSTLYMFIWMKHPFSVAALRVRQLSYYAHLYALRDYLLGTLEEWKPTGAITSSARYLSCCKFFTFLTIATPASIFLLIGIRIWEGYDPINFTLLIAFTLYHMYLTVPIIDDLS